MLVVQSLHPGDFHGLANFAHDPASFFACAFGTFQDDVANFVLIHFPQTKGKTAEDADAFLTQRGLILRALKNYKLPHALRMTVGTEEANRRTNGPGNGKADAGEVVSLESAGVASIDLGGQAVDRIWNWGENITVNTGSFTRTDGTHAAFSDVALSFDLASPRGLAPIGPEKPFAVVPIDSLVDDDFLVLSAADAESGTTRALSPIETPVAVPMDWGDVAPAWNAAAQLSQAIAAFNPGEGIDDLVRRDDPITRQDFAFAGSSHVLR